MFLSSFAASESLCVAVATPVFPPRSLATGTCGISPQCWPGNVSLSLSLVGQQLRNYRRLFQCSRLWSRPSLRQRWSQRTSAYCHVTLSLPLARSLADSRSRSLARSLARQAWCLFAWPPARTPARLPARRPARSLARSLVRPAAWLAGSPLARSLARPAVRSPGRSAACCSAGPRLLFTSSGRLCTGRLSAAASLRKGKAGQSVCARAAASVSACQWSDRVPLQGLILTGNCLALSISCVSLSKLGGPAEVQLR